MAIKAPKWAQDAIPSLEGWHHPDTGEVLKSANHSIKDIAEWNHVEVAPAPAPVVAPAPQTLNEAPSVERHITENEATHFGFKTTH